MERSHSSDGLARWLLGGLVGGLVVLGLMIAAYAIGYYRGETHGKRSVAPTTTARQLTSPTTTTAPSTTTTSQSPAQLLALGKRLFTSDTCSACHSLTGAAGAGPTLKGLSGSTVTLNDGSTVAADDAYLTRSITDPNAQIVKGYQPNVMSTAVASLGLQNKPTDVQALVTYIKAQR
jgi:mono/diheme cytochrome c family protein